MVPAVGGRTSARRLYGSMNTMRSIFAAVLAIALGVACGPGATEQAVEPSTPAPVSAEDAMMDTAEDVEVAAEAMADEAEAMAHEAEAMADDAEAMAEEEVEVSD